MYMYILVYSKRILLYTSIYLYILDIYWYIPVYAIFINLILCYCLWWFRTAVIDHSKVNCGI
jgi:hypothetical protein